MSGNKEPIYKEYTYRINIIDIVNISKYAKIYFNGKPRKIKPINKPPIL